MHRSVLVSPPPNSPKRHAGHFTPIGMCAVNAMQNIQQVNVRAHQPSSAQMLENRDLNLLIQVLGSQPLASVKVDWFENLLVGYSPALKPLLVDGFLNGFQIIFFCIA